MTTTPDFRALCAELLAALETEGFTHWTINPGEDPLCERARAALVTPPPEPPTDQDLWAFWNNHDGPIPAILRAALEMWGHR